MDMPATPEAPASSPQKSVVEKLKPFAAPYYLTVAAVLGGITILFAVVTGIIVLVVTNFNILSLIE
jgi:hypothetical protein